jgi:transcriptional regulator with XRE-family HTH domain
MSELASESASTVRAIGKVIPLRGQALEPLWREVLGDRLRSLRTDRDETLAQTAERAGISPQYLSEIERGRKEASSEMIAALAGALGVTVADLMGGTAADLRRIGGTILAAGPVITRTATAGSATRSAQRPSGPVALAA